MNFFRSIIIPFISVILSLILLFVLKARITGLSLGDSNLFFIGNLFSFLIYAFVLTGILLIHLKKNVVKNFQSKIIKLISFALLIPLLIILLFLLSDISFPGMYFLGFPLEKIFISSLFILYKFTLLFLLFFVWGIFFVSGYRLYVYSTVFAAAALGAFFIFTFFYSLGYSEHIISADENEKNLAFVLGAAVWQKNKPSPLFEGRIKKSLELYNNGIISKIQVTGSNAPGELSEAKTAYNYLLTKGVAASDILVEENSSNTHQQIKYLIKNDYDYTRKFDNIILISDEFHMARIQEICKYYRLSVVTVKSDYELNWQKLLYYRIRETVALFLFWLFGI